MSSAKDFNPLKGKPPKEVPLKNAPLIRVIAQVRFPVIAATQKDEFIAPFQEAIRPHYPILRPERIRNLILGPEGQSEGPPAVVWRFSDMTAGWRVSLGRDFLAIETTSYESREDFFARFRFVAEALEKHVNPRVMDRLGVRYIDRVVGKEVEKIASMLRPEICGVASTVLRGDASQVLREALFSTPEGASLRARWGLIPAKGTTDPAAIEPVDDVSWILDLDMFSNESGPLESGKLLEDARSYAERIYAFFRWAVNDRFLETYGGTK